MHRSDDIDRAVSPVRSLASSDVRRVSWDVEAGNLPEDHGRRTMRTRRWTAAARAAAVPAAALCALAGPAEAALAPSGPYVRVVVTGLPGAEPAVAHAVAAAGGHVEAVLGVVDGVSAEVAAGAVETLR